MGHDMLTIAVTGSSGSVGTAIVARALRDGHQVRAIDTIAPKAQPEKADRRHEFIQADLSDYDRALEALEGCDAVRSPAMTIDGDLRTD